MISAFPKTIIDGAKGIRKLLLCLLEPFDYASRIINGKNDFPPLYLRRYVGPLRTFESSGAEFKVYIKLIGEINNQAKILDLGCGCGLMALFLSDYLEADGEYFGLELSRSCIKWCKNNFRTRKNYHFFHIDVKNNIFNPKGKYSAENYVFDFKDESFDFILLKSVFTHMTSEGVNNYLKEISRLLSKRGRALITFFLLNEKQRILEQNSLNKILFRHGEGESKYRYKHSPESAIAYKEEYIAGLLERNRLIIRKPIYYGSWSGRDDGISYQDMILIERSQ